MVRSFDGSAVDEKWLDKVCENALWSPTAGNSAGVRIYTVSKEHVASYFEVATDKEWRESSKRSESLMRCGAVVIITSRPNDYIARYAEDDKAKSGLSEKDAWPIPYWHTDAAMAAMAASSDFGSIGSTQVTEINITPGVSLVGMLPKEFELATDYCLGICSTSQSRQLALDFASLLTSMGAASVRQKIGFELN